MATHTDPTESQTQPNKLHEQIKNEIDKMPMSDDGTQRILFLGGSSTVPDWRDPLKQEFTFTDNVKEATHFFFYLGHDTAIPDFATMIDIAYLRNNKPGKVSFFIDTTGPSVSDGLKTLCTTAVGRDVEIGEVSNCLLRNVYTYHAHIGRALTHLASLAISEEKTTPREFLPAFTSKVCKIQYMLDAIQFAADLGKLQPSNEQGLSQQRALACANLLGAKDYYTGKRMCRGSLLRLIGF